MVGARCGPFIWPSPPLGHRAASSRTAFLWMGAIPHPPIEPQSFGEGHQWPEAGPNVLSFQVANAVLSLLWSDSTLLSLYPCFLGTVVPPPPHLPSGRPCTWPALYASQLLCGVPAYALGLFTTASMALGGCRGHNPTCPASQTPLPGHHVQ